MGQEEEEIETVDTIVPEPSREELNNGVLIGVLGAQGSGKTILLSAFFNTIQRINVDWGQVLIDPHFPGNSTFTNIHRALAAEGRPPAGSDRCHYIRVKTGIADTSPPLYLMDFKGGDLDRLMELDSASLKENPDVGKLNDMVAECSALLLTVNAQHLPGSNNNPKREMCFPYVYENILLLAKARRIPTIIAFTQFHGAAANTNIDDIDFVKKFMADFADIPHSVEKVLCYKTNGKGVVQAQGHGGGIWSDDTSRVFGKLFNLAAPNIMERMAWIAAQKEEAEKLRIAAEKARARRKANTRQAILAAAVITPLLSFGAYLLKDSWETGQRFNAVMAELDGLEVKVSSSNGGIPSDALQLIRRAKDLAPGPERRMANRLADLGGLVQVTISDDISGRSGPARTVPTLQLLRTICNDLPCSVDGAAFDRRVGLLNDIQDLPKLAPLPRLVRIDALRSVGSLSADLRAHMEDLRNEARGRLRADWKQTIFEKPLLDEQMDEIGTISKTVAHELEGDSLKWARNVLAAYMVQSLIVTGENPHIREMLRSVGINDSADAELAQVLIFVRDRAQRDGGRELYTKTANAANQLAEAVRLRSPQVASVVSGLVDFGDQKSIQSFSHVATDSFKRLSAFSTKGIRPEQYSSSVEMFASLPANYQGQRMLNDVMVMRPLHVIEMETVAAAAASGWARRRTVETYRWVYDQVYAGLQPSTTPLDTLLTEIDAIEPANRDYLRQTAKLFTAFREQIGKIHGAITRNYTRQQRLT
ncbi:hypothetical protein, partial [Magnetospirillum sp. UT-4]|uniref:hypothetical protein n=1 Tax=Magnetospirillum sp. UT-4 TaxID=2681467 RepID=UPI001574A88F